MMRKYLYLLVSIFLFNLSCQSPQKEQESQLTAIEDAILNDKESFYHIDFEVYENKENLSKLPIGVFDSGTGGLTILDALVNYDSFNNETTEQGADGQEDFKNERFIYLADQANMPYGNYFSEGKTELLQEHIIKDLQFLLSDKYYLTGDKEPKEDKDQVKAIVIACNTATAYGFKEAKEFFKNAGLDIPLIGVIEAAGRGTISKFDKEQDASIGVFATVGTIASDGYQETLTRLFDEAGHEGKIKIFGQGGHGVAEAVDEEPDFINPEANTPRDAYRGPSLEHQDYPIDRALLDIYNFDYDHGKMLCDTENPEECEVLQINSTENYVRYHLVSMLEDIRKTEGAPELGALILGCTHYPYLIDEIKLVLNELTNYTDKNGDQPYKELIAEDVHIIDPAEYVAQELYLALNENDLMNDSGDMFTESEFYISVANKDNPEVDLDESGRMTYDYKYGRNEGEIQEYIKVVPFDYSNISKDTWNRLKEMIPATYALIEGFHHSNGKTSDIASDLKIN